MNGRIGVILLDKVAVVMGIFAHDRNIRWEKLYYQVRNLTFKSQEQIDHLAIVETLAELLLFGLKLKIKRWKILSRNLPMEILKQISQVTKLKIQNLDLKTEQELICKGVLSEIK